MSEEKYYVAIGEEAARGTPESTTVGFMPLNGFTPPKMEFDDQPRKDFRGEASIKGSTAVRRLGQKWSWSGETDFFTEAGTVSGMVATVLKHFFGGMVLVPNGATGQYSQLFYPSTDPFGSSGLGVKALTANFNLNEGDLMKNWPFVGGRVSAINLTQEMGQSLKFGFDMFGQYRAAVTAEIGSPAYAAENLRCDYNNMTVYTGIITRVGVAPDYTDFTFGSATQIKVEKISIKIENGTKDEMRAEGVDYPTKTMRGQFKVSVEISVDWEDPASGFSSVDDFNAWMAAASETNLFAHWDTGVQAGTGDNHSFYVDMPRLRRTGGEPSFSDETNAKATLTYEGLVSATTLHQIMTMLKNTVSAA